MVFFYTHLLWASGSWPRGESGLLVTQAWLNLKDREGLVVKQGQMLEREGVLFVCSILGYECKRETTVQHGMIKGLLRGSPGPVLLHTTMKWLHVLIYSPLPHFEGMINMFLLFLLFLQIYLSETKETKKNNAALPHPLVIGVGLLQ